jgi:sulfonate transport system ATP-binding protein
MNLEVEGVKFGYATKRNVLNNVSFSAADGEIVAVLGASGCGKSTLLRVICGILPASNSEDFAGNVMLDGRKPNHDLRSRGMIGFLFQEPSLLPCLNVLENVRLPVRLMKQSPPKDNTDDLIDRVGLTRFRHFLPRELSGGMQTRVALARTLVTDPQLLLLDEPFSSLDFGWKRRLYDLFTLLHSSNRTRTSILVTHDIEEAFLLATKILLLANNGTIIQTIRPPSSKPATFQPREVDEYLAAAHEDLLLTQDLIMTQEYQ